jgi:hypothetical protein
MFRNTNLAETVQRESNFSKRFLYKKQVKKPAYFLSKGGKEMKKVLVMLMVLGMGWVSIAFADLSKNDIEEIRKIVKEEVQGLRQEMITRIDDVKTSVNTRIDDVKTSVNTRIDDVKTRIDALQDLLYVILAGMFALVGFVIWDRRTALAPAIRKAKELEEEEEKIKKALREYAFQEPKLATALRQVGLM